MSFHDWRVVHGSEPNVSALPCRGLATHLCTERGSGRHRSAGRTIRSASGANHGHWDSASTQFDFPSQHLAAQQQQQQQQRPPPPPVSPEQPTRIIKPLPDKLVVLTFDDGAKSHLTVAGPLLQELGFGATFFITEGLGIPEDNRLPEPERTFMTWPEVKQLDRLGGGRFEIANHTEHHAAVTALSHDELTRELQAIDARCAEHDIPPTSTFCYPGYHNTPAAARTLQTYGMGFARRGSTWPNLMADDVGDPGGIHGKAGETHRGLPYDPAVHAPLLVPTCIEGGPNMAYTDFVWAAEQARGGKACVVTFHGVPDANYDFVSTTEAQFTKCMRYLHREGYTVIALRELAEFVEPARPLLNAKY